ncbi:25S rRNA (cytosine-C(5))-methyltransferase nop2 [Aspergillus awamori]|uniref:Nucleolar protein 2 n=1 Tax=Aspergillus awamori TaxID=105351 RepID=A0A401L151_ASPAW|nr:25S rRNA (cytosine-C(5))-methyltransferase nop2 [Aspergillus awamori]GKZ55834.1 rRNA (cytosine-C5-)-methyltransferase nop2 [Aspergillus niger]GKZ71529.1 rRNA (cytosine-C5-)-methyltransferase nop2 [Aspergillus niger]GLA07288.1 rRNA (cytosine-C5-)-methyltransferase nop2 [Aspergillus niger]GLA37486.1 rRNA (cytosine-C5-)-methyltransferase nop2 [Aspergillus niger]
MGVGRRMKKQGPPAPLDESKITIFKKRKAGEPESKPETGKKRRRADADEENVAKPVVKKKANGVANGKATKAAAKPKAETKPKAKAVEKKPQFMDSDDEDEDEDMSGIEEMDADEFDDLDGVSDGSMDSQAEDSDSFVDSDEDDHPREAMFSDDEDLSDAEERLTAANIEGLSRKLDLQRQEEEEEAEREMKESAMQTNIAGDRPDVFGDAEGTQPGLAPDLQLLRTRITDTIRILGDLKTLGAPGKSRTDYTELLIADICTYYGYTPYLAEKLFNLFTPMEAFAFFEANETPRPVVIRTNTLRTNRRSLAQALINRGVVLEPVGKWSKVGLQVFESAVPLGATPEYLAGHYIIQAASSFLPVMALAPQPNERVLDMASAPGGKTTYISALMRNTGCVIANDASKPRAKGLIGNIHRLGCKNTIVTNMDARTAFPKAMGGFDRVLLDAPCTGTGVISKDPSVKTSKNERDFLAIPHMQRQLLLAAIDSVDHASKTGGYVVYSTCSVTVEENEAVVQYVLRKRPNVKLVDTGLGDFGSPGMTSYMGKHFDPKMTLTRRYFPHRENVDGFFVCKLKKTAATPTPKPGDAAAAAATDGNSAKKSKTPSVASTTTDDDEPIDKTPITDEDGMVIETEGGSFGPFEEDEEDAARIARAERNRLRRKGLNPKAILNKPAKSKSKDESSAPTEKTEEKEKKKEESPKKETPAKKESKESPKPKADSKPTKTKTETAEPSTTKKQQQKPTTAQEPTEKKKKTTAKKASKK